MPRKPMGTALRMQAAAQDERHTGGLGHLLARLGWSSLELSRRSNVRLDALNEIISLAKYPTERVANSIQRALGDAGEYLDVLELWPMAFVKLREGKRLAASSIMQWESLSSPEVMQLPVPENKVSGLEEEIEAVMSRLPKRANEVLKRRFWNRESHQRIGRDFGVTRTRVRQIESYGLWLLTQPACIRKLARYKPRQSKSRIFRIEAGSDGRITNFRRDSHNG
jgi:hypothetical protein